MGYEGKTLVNGPLLEEVVRLRREAASILGYNNYAEWVLEVKMAKTPATVFDFLADLETKLRPLGESEKTELLALKKEIHAAKGWEFDGKLYLWDYRFYDRLWMEKNLQLGACCPQQPSFVLPTDAKLDEKMRRRSRSTSLSRL